MAECGDISTPEQDENMQLLHETSREDNIFMKMLQGASREEIVVILAGKAGAGKTTLFQNMVGEDVEIVMSADPTTDDIYSKKIEKNGKKIIVYDTPGLIGDEKTKKKLLESWSEKVKEKHVDLLVCCVPVGGSSKFKEDGYPLIMQCLHKTFGSEIWERCVVVYTFCNQALDRFQRKYGQENCKQVNATYIEFFQQYSRHFQDELENLEVKNIQIKSIFEWKREKNNKYPGPGIILGIPAGDLPKDRVLPGINEDKIPYWTDLMFQFWLMKCDIDCVSTFIECQYGKEAKNYFIITLSGLIGAGAGGVGAGVIGAKVGSKTGVLIGALAAGSVGAVLGGLIGMAIGVTVSIAVAKKVAQKCLTKDDTKEEEKKTK